MYALKKGIVLHAINTFEPNQSKLMLYKQGSGSVKICDRIIATEGNAAPRTSLITDIRPVKADETVYLIVDTFFNKQLVRMSLADEHLEIDV